MLQQNGSIHDNYNDVMRMYEILQNLSKNHTEEEEATKVANGLTGQLFKNVQLMNPISPTDFLSNAANGIEVTRWANQKIRPIRDTIVPYAMINPLEVPVDYAYKNGYSNQNNGRNKRNRVNWQRRIVTDTTTMTTNHVKALVVTKMIAVIAITTANKSFV